MVAPAGIMTSTGCGRDHRSRRRVQPCALRPYPACAPIAQVPIGRRPYRGDCLRECPIVRRCSYQRQGSLFGDLGHKRRTDHRPIPRPRRCSRHHQARSQSRRHRSSSTGPSAARSDPGCDFAESARVLEVGQNRRSSALTRSTVPIMWPISRSLTSWSQRPTVDALAAPGPPGTGRSFLCPALPSGSAGWTAGSQPPCSPSSPPPGTVEVVAGVLLDLAVSTHAYDHGELIGPAPPRHVRCDPTLSRPPHAPRRAEHKQEANNLESCVVGRASVSGRRAKIPSDSVDTTQTTPGLQ